MSRDAAVEHAKQVFDQAKEAHQLQMDALHLFISSRESIISSWINESIPFAEASSRYDSDVQFHHAECRKSLEWVFIAASEYQEIALEAESQRLQTL